MNIYQDYIQEIEERKTQGLHPKPIDSAELLSAIIEQIKDTANEHRADSLNFSSIILYQVQQVQLV
jgi:aconitate hydratase 2/2-methylisocitrate dehydratase